MSNNEIKKNIAAILLISEELGKNYINHSLLRNTRKDNKGDGWDSIFGDKDLEKDQDNELGVRPARGSETVSDPRGRAAGIDPRK